MHYRNIQDALYCDRLKGEANWASHIIVRNKMVHVLVGWIGKHVKCHALSQGIRCFGFWLVESGSQLNVTLNRKVYWVHCILIGFEQTQLSATMICVLIGSKEKPTKCHVPYHKFSTHTRSVVFTHSKYIYISFTFHPIFTQYHKNNSYNYVHQKYCVPTGKAALKWLFTTYNARERALSIVLIFPVESYLQLTGL